MFERLKKLKEAFTQSSENDNSPKVKPKTEEQRRERFGKLTHDQMTRLGDSEGSLLSQPQISPEALKSLEESRAESRIPEKIEVVEAVNPHNIDEQNNDTYDIKQENEIPDNSAFEEAEFGDVSPELMSSLSLSSSNFGQDVKKPLPTDVENKETLIEKVTSKDNKKETLFIHSTNLNEKYPLSSEANNFAQTIATNYSQGDVEGCILQLRNFLNQNKGEVNHKFWYMLMDTYQVINDKSNFEKTALAFAQLFNTSPPSWFESSKLEKKSMMAGKNILILDPNFGMEHVPRFKDFFKASKQEKFCRINVGQCRFEQSDIEALKEFYKLLVQLRKARIKSFLMAEGSLLSFAKTYMNFDPNQKGLKQHFMDNEAFFWNLYLELLQWKGKEEEFEQVAFEFAEKFEISPNGWENDGVMSLDLSDAEEDDKPQLDHIITNNNVSVIQEIVKYDFAKMNKAELDFTFVDRVDFNTCGSIPFLLKDIVSKPENANKDIYLVRPNEMILTLFDMLGTTESFKIVHKKR